MKKIFTLVAAALLVAAPALFTSCDDDPYWYDDDEPWWYDYDDGGYGWNDNYYNNGGNDNDGSTAYDEAEVLQGEWDGTMVYTNGDDADPLYKFLKEQKGFAGWDESHPIYPVLDKMLSEADPDYKEKPDIKWNFTKFLINKKGQVVKRYEPTEKIENIAKDIEALL